MGGRWPKRASGVALITSLLAITVVTLLLMGFLANQRSHLFLTRYAAEKMACRDASESLAQACRFRLEQKRAWGRTFSDEDAMEYRDSSGLLTLRLWPIEGSEAAASSGFKGLHGLTYFRGEVPTTGVQLFVSVVNNLEGLEENPTFKVGAKSFRLQIRTELNGYADRVGLTLRRAAYFDSTVLASKDLNIRGDSINFSSTDPLRNQIRSEDKITLPDIPNLKFTPSVDSLAAEKGTIWSKGDIAIDGVTDEAKLQAAEAATGGEFLAKAPSKFTIPELKKDEVDFDDEASTHEIDPGNYAFTSVAVKVSLDDGTEVDYSAPAITVNDGPPTYYDAYEPPEGVNVTATVIVPPSAVLTDHSRIDIGGITFDLPGTTAILSALTRNQSKGDLSISGGGLAFSAPPPLPDEPPKRGYLSVTGNFSLNGSLGNCGKLIASEDIHLAPADLTIEDLGKANDVAVYAGGSVRISPPYDADSDFRSNSLRYFVFRGLVYAGKDFTFSSSGFFDGEKYSFDRKLLLEGSLVAKTGKVNISGKDIELRYNRDFLDDLLENPNEHDLIQIEEVSWRPF